MAKKLHAREMKHDRFREETGKALTRATPFLHEHQRALTIGGVALLVVVIAWSASSTWLARRRVASQDQLARAVASLREASADATSADATSADATGDTARATAATALETARGLTNELVDQHGSTSAGRLGAYLRGTLALRQGQPAEAVTLLQAFVDDNPRHALVPSALAALAAAQEDAGDVAGAETTLRRVADGTWEMYPAAAALMDLARFYDRQGRRAEARAIYERLTSEDAFTDSPYASTARRELDG
jgi:TolA-binding protein